MSVKQFPVEEEYAKNPGITPGDITKLHQWVQTQPHLPRQYLDDLDLVLTYHCCENSAEVAKQVLDLHFTLRTLFTNFFKDRCLDSKVDYCLNNFLFSPLPTPTVKGYRAIYVRLLQNDPKHFSFNDAIKTFMMVFDLWQQEEGTWPGFSLILDLDTLVIGYLAKIDLMSLRQTLYFLQEAMLVKLKEVHFLNAPSFMDKLMMMLKPFLKKELMEMIQIHQKNSPNVYKFIPKEAFPKNSGGSYKDHDTLKEEQIALIKANVQYFRDENRKRVTESLRQGKKTTVEDLFGIQGSFKKLDID